MVLPNSNIRLCKQHFIKYFERKVLKTIAKYKLINPNDRAGVAVSGGKDSFTVLYLLNQLADKKREFEIMALAIDEGIKDYRDLKNLKGYCKEHNINLKIYSFIKEFGFDLDEAMKMTEKTPCAVCGVLRRYVLNSKARELKLNKLATGHNLDDEAQSILMNQIRGNISQSSRLGPSTGSVMDKKFVQRIKPLYFMTEKEVKTYSFLKGFPVDFRECKNSFDTFRSEIRDMLNNLEANHPGSKHSIANSFLEMLPILKEKFSYLEVKPCEKCGEPCSGNVCKACEMIGSIKRK